MANKAWKVLVANAMICHSDSPFSFGMKDLFFNVGEAVRKQPSINPLHWLPMLKSTDLPKVTVAINMGAKKSSHLPKLRTFCIFSSAFSALLVKVSWGLLRLHCTTDQLHPLSNNASVFFLAQRLSPSALPEKKTYC